MRYPVQLDPRHLERMSGPLLTGLIELIWNAVDADASHVEVLLKDNGLGGVSEIEVRDDGHGIDPQTARDYFLALGRSWKADGARSRQLGRPLHGKEGRGRFRMFRHGGIAVWESVSDLSGTREKIRIAHRHGDHDIEIEELGETDGPLGTRVILSGFGSAPQGLTGRAAMDRLIVTFVLAIESYSMTIVYDGTVLDPAALRRAKEDIALATASGDEATLTVVEWRRQVGQQDLFLCNAGGAVIDKTSAEVTAAGTHYTAYLRWDGFAKHLANLPVAEMEGGEVAEVIEAGRNALEQHLAQVSERRLREVIARWKQEGVYPFSGESADMGDRVARTTFDVVALEAADTINRSGTRTSKKLALRLLREALEHNPGHVHKVLDEVLSLEPERLDGLVRLLERTQLSQIISASTAITDRLDFLQALADLTCGDAARDTLLERPLHRILEEETWVFGEEYALALSEAGLTQVLAKHIELLGRDEPATETVKGADGRARRVDLLLSAVVARPDDVHEHLVVELKRPGVAIGPTELQQVKDYALAVANHDLFDKRRTMWEFWAISTRVEGTADRERRSHPEFGLAFVDPEFKIRVWVKTWAELIHDAGHRLKYVRDQLGVAADQASALQYLDRVHSEKLPGDMTGRDAA